MRRATPLMESDGSSQPRETTVLPAQCGQSDLDPQKGAVAQGLLDEIAKDDTVESPHLVARSLVARSLAIFFSLHSLFISHATIYYNRYCVRKQQ